MHNVNMDLLRIGDSYTSIDLAEMWGYQDFHPLARGIVTPSGTKKILLFVTLNKEADRIQYIDSFDGHTLRMEGQQKHGTDHRIAGNLNYKTDDFFLFCRKTKFEPFTYYGKCVLNNVHLHQDEPSVFEFTINND